MSSNHILAGVRLILRPLTKEDVGPAYVTWMQDPNVNQYLEARFANNSVDELQAYVTAATADPDTRLFAIVLSGSERHIGNVKLGPIDHHHRRCDIGILLGDRECWGRGYATEAISMLCSFAFDQLDLHKITAGAYASNGGSINAFLRAGFEIEGRRIDHYLSDGQWVDGVLLAKIRSHH